MTLRNSSIGATLRGEPKRITAARLLAFSGGPITETGWPRKNIHTSTDFAKSTGLPARCASGTQFQGHMVEFLISLFGESWFGTGKMSVRFIDLVFEDQTVAAHAKLTDRREQPGGRLELDLEIWSEREDGRQVMAGTARGVLQ